jgi:EmrB/QacA subfamily drug resistance transporter
MGVFGLILMFAPAIGPTLSGWIIEHYDWRMLFHFVTPIAIVVVLLGFFLLKDKKEKVDVRLDFLAVVLSSVGFGGILYGFSKAGTEGWDSPQVYGTLAVGVISLVTFILRQLRQERPLLNFRIYKYPMFALSSAISMVVTMAMFSGMLLLPIYVQNIRGISPMDAGLMLLPGAILMAIMMPITGKLFDKFGGRALAVIGLVITVVTSYFLSKLTLETTYTELIILYTVRMFGMSMVNMPVTTNGLNQLPARFYPHGTAMNNTLSQVAGAIGTALLVTVMTTRAKAHATELIEAAKNVVPNPAIEVTKAMKLEMQHQIELQSMLAGINDAFLSASLSPVLLWFLPYLLNALSKRKIQVK